MQIVNMELLRSPASWLVVWSMLLVWVFLFEAISRHPSFNIEAND